MSDYGSEFSIRRLWIIFAAIMVDHVRRSALLRRPDLSHPSRRSQALSGRRPASLYTGADIQRGQNVWQSMGGMQQGSIWGHGSYVAPDWSADWLHREAVALRDEIAGTGAKAFDALAEPDQARFGAILKREMRTNSYDPQTTIITVSDQRAAAITATAAHYERPVHQPHARPTSICASFTQCRKMRSCRPTKRMR